MFFQTVNILANAPGQFLTVNGQFNTADDFGSCFEIDRYIGCKAFIHGIAYPLLLFGRQGKGAAHAQWFAACRYCATKRCLAVAIEFMHL